MKIRYKIGFIFLSLILLNSCGDDFTLDAPEDVRLDVRIKGVTETDPATGAYIINAGELVNFEFVGDKVDNILFYSGEIGMEYRYRNRGLAENGDNLQPTILIKTALSDVDASVKSKFTFMVTDGLKEYNKEAVEQAQWDESAIPLRNNNVATAAVTQYYTPKKGLQSSNVKDDEYSKWYTNEFVTYAIKAKSNTATKMRLQLQQFDVKNTETRDYSYTLDGVPISVKKTKDHQIFKAFSLFDASYKVANDMTAACWAGYTPLTTIKEGESSPVPNSQWYIWNVAELGLKYGEGSGYPWVKTNQAGQDIKCVYNTDIFVPNKNIVLPDGTITDTPTDEMKAEPSESWLISRNHYTKQVSKDAVTSYVKTKVMSMVWAHKYVFTSKGAYTMTFVINNQNVDETKEIVKEIKVIVK